MKTLTVRVEPDLHRRLKVVLAREGKSFQFVFSDYLRRYLEVKEADERAQG